MTHGSDQTTTWPAGSRVAIIDRSRMVGTVRYGGRLCEEDGMPTYRVKFDNGIESDMCQSVLFRVQSPSMKEPAP
jgi:hypothetical protein